MNVHPSASLNPPGPTTAEAFARDALYELRIDSDRDAVANIAYQVRSAASNCGILTAMLRRVDGAGAGMGDDGQVIVERAPVSTRREGPGY